MTTEIIPGTINDPSGTPIWEGDVRRTIHDDGTVTLTPVGDWDRASDQEPE